MIIYAQINGGGKNLDQQTVKQAIKNFGALIERSKDKQAYSDFKEGVNEGLEIAKDAFEDNADKFYLSDLDENMARKVEKLQDKYNSLIDMVEITKKPGYSKDHLDGIYKGFEISKELFGEFIEEL